MQLVALGINHQSAPLAIREKIAFPPEAVVPALHDVLHSHGAAEAAILSTCNRTELYCRTSEPDALLEWLSRHHPLDQAELARYVYRLEHRDVARHAFRVASGLDSMVLGEAQILGQMKQAVRTAGQAGSLGWLLNKLFQRTFSVAKEVRSRTDIGANSVSLAAAAVRVASRIFEDLSRQSILFVGAGEMIELALTHFAARSPKRITIANRTPERAHGLADRFDGEVITLEALPDHVAAHDIIVSCTASTLPILGKGLMERAVKARRHRPVVMIDLAVPRDIEPEVGTLDDVFLYSIDDLGHIVEQGIGQRQAAATQAEAIIEASVSNFVHWMEARDAVPTIRQLRDQAEQYRAAELDRARRMLARGDDPHEVMEAMSHGLVNKMLHEPTHALNHARSEERAQLVEMLQRWFGPKHFR
jgi:glutamyl-tRNA reductase